MTELGSVISELVMGHQFLEITNGTSQLKDLFHPFKYSSAHWADEEFPRRYSIVLYDVLQHVPQDKIDEVLKKVMEAAEDQIIIASFEYTILLPLIIQFEFELTDIVEFNDTIFMRYSRFVKC